MGRGGQEKNIQKKYSFFTPTFPLIGAGGGGGQLLNCGGGGGGGRAGSPY